MIKAFIETNILIDLLSDRREFTTLARKIFTLNSVKDDLTLCTSSHAIATVYYILGKHSSDAFLRDALFGLINRMEILAVDIEIMKSALLAKDFEDGNQYFSALNMTDLDYIVSRDKKGFKESKIPVLDSLEFLNLFTTSSK